MATDRSQLKQRDVRIAKFGNTLEVLSIWGAKRPEINRAYQYEWRVKLEKDRAVKIRRVDVTFGLSEDATRYNFQIDSYEPQARRDLGPEVAVGVKGYVTIGKFNPFGRRSIIANAEDRFVRWTFKELPDDGILRGSLSIVFLGEQSGAKQPSTNKSFRFTLTVEPLFEKTLFRGSFSRSPAIYPNILSDLLTEFIEPVEPYDPVRGTRDTHITIESDSGIAMMGPVRQVIFRPASVFYFFKNLKEGVSLDEFERRIFKASREIGITWRFEVAQHGVIRGATLNDWADYDTRAGLGLIQVSEGDASTMYVKIRNPFSTEYQEDKELVDRFWVGYLGGLISAIKGGDYNVRLRQSQNDLLLFEASLTSPQGTP